MTGWIIPAVLILLLLPGFYAGLTVRHYTIESDKITHSVRLAVLSDHHSCRYGKEQQKLLDAVAAEEPDAILLPGDIFDDKRPNTETEYLLRGLADRYPCYYVTGNHEYWASEEAFQEKMALLEKYGVRILKAEADTVSLNGETMVIAGVDDPDKALAFKRRRGQTESAGTLQEELSALDASLDEAHFSVLLSHRPELFPLYRDTDFDLVVSGHAHGGQWRIPGILNGLYAPHQGFFPKYAGGRYDENGTTMIVSRGLARESTIVPRFCNPPELVIIDVIGKQ